MKQAAGLLMSGRWLFSIHVQLIAMLAVASVAKASVPELETLNVEGEQFSCLGNADRTFLGFSFYTVSFCVDQKALPAIEQAARRGGDADAFVTQLAEFEVDRLFRIKLVRDVSAARMRSAFRDALQGILSEQKLAHLADLVGTDAVAGDVVLLYGIGDRLTLDHNGEQRSVVDAEIVSKFSQIWLGSRTVTPSLRADVAATMRALTLP
jgi:hypothetical protein